MRALAVGLLLIATCAGPAWAQKGPFGLGEDLRLEGIVAPSEADKAQTLGTIKIRAGKMVRKFGVLHAQTARTEGMSLFNRSQLHPEQLLLRADKSLLNVFRNAPAGTRLRMLGRYTGDDYILAEVTPVDASATPSTTAQPH
jgi:hypothetical protein